MKKFNLLVVGLLLISLWMNYSLYQKVDHLNYAINGIQNDVYNKVTSIRSDIYQATKQIKEKALWVRSSDYEVVGVNDTFTEFTIDLSFTLNEKQNNEQLYIVLTDEDGNEETKLVPSSESLNYNLQLFLGDKDYTLNLLGKTAMGSRSEEIRHIGLQRVKDDIVSFDGRRLSQRYSSTSDVATVDFIIAISSIPQKSLKGLANLVNEFKFTEVTADVYMGLEYLETIDLKNGEGYEPKDPREDFHRVPEVINDNDVEVYAGTYQFDAEIYKQYLDSGDRPETLFLVKAVDSKGNEYLYIMDDHEYYWDGTEIKKYR